MTKDGHHYTHSFFTLSVDDFKLKSVSFEFCFASPYFNIEPLDCEVVQFVSGMVLRQKDEMLIISYGVNDCESRIIEIPLQWALDSLKDVEE